MIFFACFVSELTDETVLPNKKSFHMQGACTSYHDTLYKCSDDNNCDTLQNKLGVQQYHTEWHNTICVKQQLPYFNKDPLNVTSLDMNPGISALCEDELAILYGLVLTINGELQDKLESEKKSKSDYILNKRTNYPKCCKVITTTCRKYICTQHKILFLTGLI